MTSHLGVMTEGDNTLTEVRVRGDIDAAMEVQEPISVRPFFRTKGAGGRLVELFHCFGNWFLLWVLNTFADVVEDVQFWASEFQAF